MTSCTDCRALLVDYERGELDAARDAAVYEHIQSCDECRAAWRSDIEMVDAVRAWSAPREFPTSVLAGVRQAMHAEPAPSFLERLRLALRPAIAAPVGAAVLIAVWVVGNHAHSQAPTLTGMDYVRAHVAQTAGLPSSDRAWSTYLLTSANAENDSDDGSSSNG
ncbi:MAG TPA: zf-HC2 domain-containing protein [Candidatus Eremiobacteraceae bacterium]|nr:zf-HC2 domain-containing protein [Candidatus Eremiobacteraceae bacterium]